MSYFGFIGCGNMGSALVLSATKSLERDKIAVCDFDTEKTKPFTENNKAVFASKEQIAEKSKYIFLGVKPQVLSSLVKEIAPILKARVDYFVIVSMAAGVTINDIFGWLGFDCKIIRIMPNTTVAVGEGMITYAVSDLVTNADEQGFLEGLKFAGKFDKLPEKLIDAASAVAGSGPAFVYMFAESLADAGVECGLPREKAQSYAAQTILGAAQMILQTGKNPADLKNAVCSPGGTTIEGVHALENGKLRGTVMNAVKATYEKNFKLKK